MGCHLLHDVSGFHALSMGRSAPESCNHDSALVYQKGLAFNPAERCDFLGLRRIRWICILVTTCRLLSSAGKIIAAPNPIHTRRPTKRTQICETCVLRIFRHPFLIERVTITDFRVKASNDEVSHYDPRYYALYGVIVCHSTATVSKMWCMFYVKSAFPNQY